MAVATASAATRRPHLVIAAYPSKGHTIPAMSFARLLASSGFHLTFASAQNSINHIQTELQTAEELAHIRCVGLPVQFDSSYQDHLPRAKVNSLMLVVEASLKMSAVFEQLMDKLVSGSLPELSLCGPPLAIISDNFCPWTQAVASKLGIPRYVLYTSPAKLLAVNFYYPSLVAQGRLPLLQSSNNKVGIKTDAEEDIIAVPALGPVALGELPITLKDSSEMVHRFFHGNACLLHEASGIFVNSFCELESSAIDALNSKILNPNKVPVFPIGPVLPYPFFPKESEAVSTSSSLERNKFTDWLDSRSPLSVLYISFGSVYTPTQAQTYEIAIGLEASQLPFFWVLPAASISDSTKPSLLSSFLPEGFEQRTQKQGLVVASWVQQPLILSHPSIGGFLTHCGWNSTVESICCGVPMIGFPQFAEQELNCTIIVDQWKIGLKLERGNDGSIRGADVERAAKRLLEGSEEAALMRTRIAEKRKAARRAIMHDGSSMKYLQAFVKEISAKGALAEKREVSQASR